MEAPSCFMDLVKMKDALLLNPETAELLDIDTFHQSLYHDFSVKLPSKSGLQDWFEIFRSTFSGIGKGQKFASFCLNFLQKADQTGHFSDTLIIYILAGVSAIIFGLTLGLRALARAFKTDKPEEKKENAKKNDGSEHFETKIKTWLNSEDGAVTVLVETLNGSIVRVDPPGTTVREEETPPERGPRLECAPRLEALPRSHSYANSRDILFRRNPPLSRSESATSLNELSNPPYDYITLDSNQDRYTF